MPSLTRSFVVSCALLCAVLAVSTSARADDKVESKAEDKAVFSVTENDEAKWNLALGNARNLQRGTAATGGAQVEIVAFGPGILTLKDGSPLAGRIHDAAASGIKVVACKNTMAAAKLVETDMLADIGFVPSGVVEVMRKQQQGYAYIRP